MHDFFFNRRHTDLDPDIKEKIASLKAKWDALLNDRRQIKAGLAQYRPDTIGSELFHEGLREQETHCDTREAEIVQEDRLLEIDSLHRGLARIKPDDSNGPRTREKLLGRIKALQDGS